jgi:hypothetical protein
MAEAGDGATSTFAYFPFGACSGPALGLFIPVLILSTPALGAAGIATLFGMAAFTGTPAFGNTLALGATPVFGTDFFEKV